MLVKDTACEARGENFKPRPLTSEKLAFGCALFNLESDTGVIQKTIIASFATCCCTKSTEHINWRVPVYTYPSTYINTVKELSRGGGGVLQPP